MSIPTISSLSLLNLCVKIVRTQKIRYTSHNLNWECIKAIRICDMKYHPNGNVESVRILHHDFKLQHRCWYESGQIWYDHWWKDGKEDGHWQDWYESGQIWYDEWYKDGNKVR